MGGGEGERGIIGENLVRDQKLSNPLIFSFIYEKYIPSLFIFSFIRILQIIELIF